VRLAVVGGGVNGLCIAWQCARAGHAVTLYERGRLLGETSSGSTKLLHGGLRYLEHGQWRLVREALLERGWWLEHVPEHARALELWLPVYRGVSRPRWMLGLGLSLYDLLAGRRRLGRHGWLAAAECLAAHPALKGEGLLGAFRFHDGQMDEAGLGAWVAGQARAAGAALHEHCPVEALAVDGTLRSAGERAAYDVVVNAAGPWAEDLLKRSGLRPGYRLDLVRGSHIVFDEPAAAGYFFQVPGEARVFFVLPYQGRTLVGTTEVRQRLDEPIACSEAEAAYLVDAYNAYFREPKRVEDVAETFAAVRPLVWSAADPGRASREHALERQGRLLTVYGGKWTTARALGATVARTVQRMGQGTDGVH
jgi:glycerol-3-phosphate dehydrogenase